MSITTTLATIRAHSPCDPSWTRLLRRLGKTQADDDPLAVVTILDLLGPADAVWALRAVVGHDRAIRDLAVRYARTYQMRDPRNLAALDLAERYARGEATDDELRDARAAISAAGAAGEIRFAWDITQINAAVAAWTLVNPSHTQILRDWLAEFEPVSTQE